ncbi:NADH-cytochrome b5 reductase [Fasciola hepatica]|uniref:NADH-cytochrome b5 reductase n=1 Tax=Fasciola hepatica TaxID=6192 RepID=A0A4E0RV74_FASHE|nr:NADH-cytochrome b5 reductase [Fasciola hepatica]
MTQYLMNLPLTQYVDVRGPAGNLHYKGRGLFDIKPDAASPPNQYKANHVSMICGGSGVTPMFQLISHILDDKKDFTKLALIFANNTEDDILLRDELENLRDKYPDQFKLWYTLVQAPSEWTYSTGYVDEKMISEHLYPPSDNSLVLLCGPAPMVEFACYPNLSKLGYSRARIFTY